MDTLQPQHAAAGQATALPHRLRELGFGTPAEFEHLARESHALGFDAIVVPPPFLTEGGLIADLGHAKASYGGGSISDAAAVLAKVRANGIAIIVDVPVGGVAAASPLHRQRPELFVAPDRSGILDPRRELDLGRARTRLDRDDTLAELGDLFGGALAALGAGAIDGIALRDLARVPGASLTRLAAALRAHLPGRIIVADTVAMPWDELDAIASGGVDYVVASSAWWNWSDDWFLDEFERLRRAAPVLVPALSLARGQPGSARARLSRDLGLAASIGAGWILPAATSIGPETAEVIRALHDALGADTAGASASSPGLALLSGIHAGVLAALRSSAFDPRASAQATISLLNTSTTNSIDADPASILPSVGGLFEPFLPRLPDGTDGDALRPGSPVRLAPGEFRLYRASRRQIDRRPPIDPGAVHAVATTSPRLALENPSPTVDGGAFPVKRCAGELVTVAVDIIGDGHDKLGAALQWRRDGDAAFEETRLVPLGNDRWQASFPLMAVGLYRYRIVAWRDMFATFRDELGKKHLASVPIALELREGTLLVEHTLASSTDEAAQALLVALAQATGEDDRRELLLAPATAAVMTRADPRPHSVSTAEIPVDAERTGAGFAAWYEVFPRSLSDDVTRHGTFRDVERHLPRVRAMGFDVLYFPPIHPIGRTNRKGPNNTLTPSDTDPGSPYAIGSLEGGHETIHPELGSFEDFQHLRQAASAHGLEIALDFAIQCAPDHPWLRDHHDWFTWRPDGSIRYAENPPKKYQDIVNVDFYADGAVPDLWIELAQVVLFWCEQGIRLFRVDNPHTKAFPFWQWMIGEVRAGYPDAVFLAEAFTRPKIMARLAKIGFSQSYTYFTWRTDKAELRAYFEELAEAPMRDFFRPHLFVNTPDINPLFLQTSGRPGFLIRAALAATLSGLWGVYNGFELCEGTPLGAGKEEYLDSEKFQLRAWDWNRPGNIVAEIAALNLARRANPALQTHLGVTFLEASSGAVLWFEKATPARDNVVLVAISLDPSNPQTSAIELPLSKSNLPDHGTLALHDVLANRRFSLTGKSQQITLTPDHPYAIWRLASPA